MRTRFYILSVILLAGFLTITAQTQIGSSFYGVQGYDHVGWSTDISDDGTIMAFSATQQPQVSSSLRPPGYVVVFENINGNWVQMGDTLTKTVNHQKFGYNLSLNDAGDILAIGVPNNSDSALYGGSVEVYQWDGFAWNQLGQTIYGIHTFANMGSTVDFNATGSRMVVGAPNSDYGASNSGHIAVYEFQNNQWVMMGSEITGSSSADFGDWVTVINGAGTIVAAQAPKFDRPGTTDEVGLVRVYEWDGSSWNQKGSDLTGAAAGGDFGVSMDMDESGNTIAIAEPNRPYSFNGGVSNSLDVGSIYVFDWDGTDWAIRGDTILGTGAFNRLGYGLTLTNSGNRMAYTENKNRASPVSSPLNGNLTLFEWDNSTTSWNQISQVTGTPGTFFRYRRLALAQEGRYIAEGNPYTDDPNGVQYSRAGALRVWDMQVSVPAPPVTCSSPYNSQATTPGNFTVDLSWNHQGYRAYRVYYRNLSTDSIWRSFKTNDTTRTITPIRVGDYEYFVAFKNGTDSSCINTFTIDCEDFTFNNQVIQTNSTTKGQVRLFGMTGGKKRWDFGMDNGNDTTWVTNRWVNRFVDIDPGTYYFHVRDKYGCYSTQIDTITINALDTTTIPNLTTIQKPVPTTLRAIWAVQDTTNIDRYQVRVKDVTGGGLGSVYANHIVLGASNTQFDITGLPDGIFRVDVRSRVNGTFAGSLYSNYRDRTISSNKTGFSQVNEGEQQMVYPNPNKGKLFLHAQAERVEIYDLSGRVVLSKKLETKNQQVDISNLSSGVYIVRLINDSRINEYKIVKE